MTDFLAMDYVRFRVVIRSAGTLRSDCSLSNVMSDDSAHGSVGRMNTYVAGSMPRRSLAAGSYSSSPACTGSVMTAWCCVTLGARAPISSAAISRLAWPMAIA